MKTLSLTAALLTLLPAMMLAGEPPEAAQSGPTTTRRGELWALVLHSETWVGLEGLPVYISKSAGNRTTPIRALTDKQGFANITGLLPGEYSVWVDFNNHQSEVATFTIGESLLAKLTIFFNPDID